MVAEALTQELQQKSEEIRVRRESVESELSEAEPSLVAAKHSVQNIRKAQLDEGMYPPARLLLLWPTFSRPIRVY